VSVSTSDFFEALPGIVGAALGGVGVIIALITNRRMHKAEESARAAEIKAAFVKVQESTRQSSSVTPNYQDRAFGEVYFSIVAGGVQDENLTFGIPAKRRVEP